MTARRVGGALALAARCLVAALALAALAAGCRTETRVPPAGPAPERPNGTDAGPRPVTPDAAAPADTADPGPDVAAPDQGPGAQPPDPSLVGHWRLDEREGSVAADSSGRDNPAALMSAPAATWTQGRIAGAIELPGGSAHLRAASSVSINGIFRAFSVSAWVFRPSPPALPTVKATALSRQGAYSLGFDGENARFAVTVDARPTPVLLLALQPSPRGQWVHLAGTFDGGTARLYVDGREAAAVAFAGTIGSSMAPVSLGARLATANPDEALSGRLDDVRLYARALAPGEVAALAAP